MTKLLAFVCCLLTAATLTMGLEVIAVRQDQRNMMGAYGEFLAKKVGGAPLSSRLRPNSLAVFKLQNQSVACGVMH